MLMKNLRNAPGVRPTFRVDPERLIDDFVFLCFLCGNDFIPNLPSLSIRDGDVSAIILQVASTLHQRLRVACPL